MILAQSLPTSQVIDDCSGNPKTCLGVNILFLAHSRVVRMLQFLAAGWPEVLSSSPNSPLHKLLQ